MLIMNVNNVLMLTQKRELQKASLSIENGQIASIHTGAKHLGQGDIDAQGWIVSPGWIDIQINGGFGIDLTTNPELLWEVAAKLPKFGVTGFLSNDYYFVSRHVRKSHFRN